MQHLEVSDAVRHIYIYVCVCVCVCVCVYIYIYVIRRLKVKYIFKRSCEFELPTAGNSTFVREM